LASFSLASTSFNATLALIHYTSNQMDIFRFSLKTINQTRTLNCLLIPSSWHSNICHIYRQVVFLGWFLTPLGLFSPWRFNEWTTLVVPTLLSYHTKSHSTPNCTCLWSSPLFSHDQTFRCNLSHYSGGNIVLTHKLCFMLLIS
jgi:hypothetical protein